MLPTLQLGPLAIQTPGLILLVGLWLGLTLAEKQGTRKGFDPGKLYNLSFIVLLAGVIGGRMAYVLQYPQAFLASPLSIISLNITLFNLWGGIGSAIIAAVWYSQKAKFELWSTLDVFTPAFAVLAVAFGLAHWASGSAFGSASDLPWAIELWGARRHPTQVYETIFACLGLGFIYWLFKSKPNLPKGSAFLAFVAFTSAYRLFLEGFRGDSQLIGSLRLAQVVAWGLMTACLLILRHRRNTVEKSDSKQGIETQQHL
jgi:phosphatidylglycerol:prolipoprotein diacylglycerol transferase